jgi:hypothetical protein
MIVNPPRSEAELSPRLRTISVHAVDQFEDPYDRPPLVPRWVIRRFTIPVALTLAALAIHLGLGYWTKSLDSPSSFAVLAEDFRAQARVAEQLARAYRAIAATGKMGALPGGQPPVSPSVALRLAKMYEQNAAGYRRQADIQEALNQGFRVP